MDLEFVENILQTIEHCLDTNTFIDFERSIVELKDLSTGGDWSSFKESVCAFLNTKGGYIICGIRERNKMYSLTGFERNNENNLIDLRTKVFKSDTDTLLDLSDYIDFEFLPFKNKTIAILLIRSISEDIKYVKFSETKGGKLIENYFERVLTADKVIPLQKIKQHQEYKQELEYSKEISFIADATIEDLDVDKINQFIIKINAKKAPKETVKKDIEDALSFLIRRHCVKNNKVTILGMLLFGRDPFRFLEYRAEVDCFFETGTEISRDKRDFQDDNLSLMDDAFRFIWGHIKVGRSAKGGGQSLPEYPEDLIRESINNALAHRDYTINRFITIKVKPGEQLEINNPGTFKSKMLISDQESEIPVRRIIPGIPETKNPKLASVLKAFEKIESEGIGMATLVSVCLQDVTDVPYYDLTKPDMIRLVIPSGKLIDEEIGFWLDSFNGYLVRKLGKELTTDYQKVLAYIYKSEKLNYKRFYTILLSESNNHFEVIDGLKKGGLIVEHRASTDAAPVYVLERELLKNNFEEELIGIISNYFDGSAAIVDYKKLDSVHKLILNIIYRNNKYNQQAIKPTQITSEVYLAEYGKIIDPKTYETLGRRVRKICERFWKLGLLNKDDSTKGYLLSKY